MRTLALIMLPVATLNSIEEDFGWILSFLTAELPLRMTPKTSADKIHLVYVDYESYKSWTLEANKAVEESLDWLNNKSM